MNNVKISDDLNKISISIAKQEDSKGVYEALLENLVEIEDFSKVNTNQIKNMESIGFLRKEEPIEYYSDMIANPSCEIFLAKESNGQIIGFASIHIDKMDIWNFRKTLSKLHIKKKSDLKLLTSKKIPFIYLDQISIYPEFKRKGIGTKIIKEIYKKYEKPVVSFVVRSPIYNKASSSWHKKNDFRLAGTCEGKYKKVYFEWEVFINSN